MKNPSLRVTQLRRETLPCHYFVSSVTSIIRRLVSYGENRRAAPLKMVLEFQIIRLTVPLPSKILKTILHPNHEETP